jgi:hypothetical protein
MQFRRGRCFMRDYEGRVGAIQVDPGAELLELLDTTPGRARKTEREGRAVGDRS